MRIGRSCRALRIRRRWRQQDVADAVGISRQLVAKVESGLIATVQLRTLEAVCPGPWRFVGRHRSVAWRGSRPTARRGSCGARRVGSRAARSCGLGDGCRGLVRCPWRARVRRHPGAPPTDRDRARGRGQVGGAGLAVDDRDAGPQIPTRIGDRPRSGVAVPTGWPSAGHRRIHDRATPCGAARIDLPDGLPGTRASDWFVAAAARRDTGRAPIPAICHPGWHYEPGDRSATRSPAL